MSESIDYNPPDPSHTYDSNMEHQQTQNNNLSKSGQKSQKPQFDPKKSHEQDNNEEETGDHDGVIYFSKNSKTAELGVISDLQKMEKSRIKIL